MKNKMLLASAVLLSAVAGAQTTPTQPSTPTSPAPAQSPTNPDSAATVLADSTVYSAYVSNPEELKGLTMETLRPEHAFPVLGNFNAAGNSAENVTITLDATNKGIVWVEGLTQGKFRAVMKKAPATYKIPAQTTESGKAVAEGTLFYNPSSKEVTIVLGRAFNDADPQASLTIPAKTKTKVTQYTGIKAAPVAAEAPASNQ